MSDLPPELRDRAARAACDVYSEILLGHVSEFDRVPWEWRAVVDAVAEVLAGHVGCEHLDGPYRRLVVERDDLRARVEQLSTMLRGMARRATDRQRRRRSAEGREHDVRLKRKLVLNRLGLALGVPFKSPSSAEYVQFEDKLCAAALRLRADQADRVVRLRARAERAEAELAQARGVVVAAKAYVAAKASGYCRTEDDVRERRELFGRLARSVSPDRQELREEDLRFEHFDVPDQSVIDESGSC